MPVKVSRGRFGDIGEEYAYNLLLQKGYRLLNRKFHSRFGEIDLIAEKDGALIFVEVKTRWSKKFGAPEEAVTPNKLWKIKRTGEYYSLLHPKLPKKLRIEVVAICVSGGKVESAKILQVF